jgi:Fur family transcriptional regulator, ferric uptake regulator
MSCRSARSGGAAGHARRIEIEYHLDVSTRETTTGALPGRPGPDGLVAALGDRGHRVTRTRVAVADLVSDRLDHFTAASLAGEARVRGWRIGRATVFRTLELFAELGLVEHLDLPDGQHAYVACAPHDHHHHHVVCSDCGRVVEVTGIGMEPVIRGVAERTGYRIVRHRVELYGTCPACRRAGEAGGRGDGTT